MNSGIIDDTTELRRRLEDWLRTRSPLGPETILQSVNTLTKGQSSDMMELVCSEKSTGALSHYILRREPRAKQLFLKPDAMREFAVMRAIERTSAVPIPKMLAAEPDEGVIGAPFLVMSRVEGFVPLGRPSMHVTGPLPGLSAETRRHLWTGAISALGAIHAIDWRQCAPFMADDLAGQNPLEAHLARLARWYEWTVGTRTFPITDQALAYLISESGKLADEPSVLLWNDARVGNMIFTPAGDVAAAIDWESATIGPAGVDFGYWVMMDEFHAEAIDVPRLAGWPSPAETVSTYERLSGRHIAQLDYYVVMAAFFIATTLIRQADLGVATGRFGADTRMGLDNTTTQIIARRLGLPVPPLSADYAAHRQMTIKPQP